MSRISLFLGGILLLTACAGEPPKIILRPGAAGEPVPVREQYEIIEHQNSPAGGPVPAWVRVYLNQGIRGVEGMEPYQDKYVFIGTNRGANFNALSHWAEAFTAAQDFPRLAAVRIEQRLIGAASLYPDDEYGEFFETLVKKASDTVYTGVVKEGSFWLLRKVHDENSPNREIYEFFVLLSTGKREFQTQVNEIMKDISPSPSATREQAAAVNRIRETFFGNF
jgi:hypothetical protein